MINRFSVVICVNSISLISVIKSCQSPSWQIVLVVIYHFSSDNSWISLPNQPCLFPFVELYLWRFQVLWQFQLRGRLNIRIWTVTYLSECSKTGFFLYSATFRLFCIDGNHVGSLNRTKLSCSNWKSFEAESIYT